MRTRNVCCATLMCAAAVFPVSAQQRQNMCANGAQQSTPAAWCIAEYHDEQRLSDGNGSGADYGPIAHVFALPAAAAMNDHTAFDDQYVNVAVVDLDELDRQMPSTYTALKLTTLHSCLYLKHNHGSGPQGDFYTALMEPGSATACPDNPFPSASNTLGARIERYSDDANDYPPVARFIEAANGRTFIGVRCANRWCIVGAEPMGGIPNAAHQGGAGVPNTRASRIKGWFDDQMLAVAAPGTRHGLQRGVRASVIPDASLGNLSIADYSSGFKIVATTFFPNAPPANSKYAQKFGFRQGANVVELKAEADASQPGGYKWTARINGAETAFKVQRTDHSRYVSSMPATARFHWSDNDEDLWIACDVGCCLINGDAW